VTFNDNLCLAFRYTRNLLDGGNGKYNVIILCWSEGQGSAIHAHSDCNCFVKVLDGQITETLYAWPAKENDEEPMHVLKKTTVAMDDVTYINGGFVSFE
jgi:cysteine dioxygenase